MSEPFLYRDGDLDLRGEIHHPVASSNGRGILVVHEADGIGGNVRRRCAMLAELGYIAAAADMHGAGRVLAPPEIEAAMTRFKETPDLLRRRTSAALDAFLAATGLAHDQTAAIGYWGAFAGGGEILR